MHLEGQHGAGAECRILLEGQHGAGMAGAAGFIQLAHVYLETIPGSVAFRLSDLGQRT